MEASNFIVSSAYYSEEPVRNDFHHHNEYEMIYVTKGSADVSINRKQYKVRENNLLIIANLENHSFRQWDADYKRYCLMLRVPIADMYINNGDMISLLRNHPESFCHCIDMGEDRETVISVIENIMACRASDEYANEYAACLIGQLLILAARRSPRQQIAELTDTCKERMLSIQTYFNKHYPEKIRISDICRMYYISSAYLSHQFKRLTGYSPKQYLTLLRLKQASVLIYDTARPIGDIAEACGFPDINNFCKLFKRHYGCSPSDFRKTNI